MPLWLCQTIPRVKNRGIPRVKNRLTIPRVNKGVPADDRSGMLTLCRTASFLPQCGIFAALRHFMSALLTYLKCYNVTFNGRHGLVTHWTAGMAW